VFFVPLLFPLPAERLADPDEVFALAGFFAVELFALDLPPEVALAVELFEPDLPAVELRLAAVTPDFAVLLPPEDDFAVADLGFDVFVDPEVLLLEDDPFAEDLPVADVAALLPVFPFPEEEAPVFDPEPPPVPCSAADAAAPITAPPAAPANTSVITSLALS